MNYNVQEILNIFKDCCFPTYFTEETVEEFVEEELNLKLEECFSYAYGASKLVLIFKDKDFVIKIPFTHDEYNDEFRYANSIEGHEWDYCYTEVEIYSAASKEQKELLAETIFIGYSGFYNDHPIYIQEKCYEYYEQYNREDSRKIVNEYKQRSGRDNLPSVSTDFIASLIDYYIDIEKVAMLCDFMEEEIEDLHFGNLGFAGDGRPIIIDYAGFRDIQ